MSVALHNTVKFLSKIEGIVTENTDFALAKDFLLEEYNNIPEAPHNMAYPVKDVPVASFNEDGNLSYGVSVHPLALFMEMNKLTDIKEAVKLIAEANNIDYRDLAVVLPPSSEILHDIQEAKDDTEPSSAKVKVNHLHRTGTMVQALKTSGLSVAKEPGVLDAKWNTNTNIVNIERTSSFGDGIDYDSLKNY